MWRDYTALIAESVEELQRLERAHRGKRTEARVKLLRLLKQGEVRSLQRGAAVVGYSYKQVWRWWQQYETGGMAALLEMEPPPGKQTQFTAEARAGVEEAMRQGKIRRLEDVRQYLAQEWGIEYRSLNGVWWMLRRWKIKLKTGRRRHQKASEEAQDGFKKNLGAKAQEKQVEENWAFDEGRFGLKVWFRRRWCPRGERPPWVFVDRYVWVWVYAAVEPVSGQAFFLLLPSVEGAWLELFLEEFRKVVGTKRVGLVMDNSGSHHSGQVTWPEGLERIDLPPYSPELNPAEQIFRELRGRLSNEVFEDVESLEARLCEELQQLWEDPEGIRRLTGYPWWLEAMQDIETCAA